MRRNNFQIGSVFVCGDWRWRCTDVGARTVVAIRLDHEDDPSWYNGPPYAVAESVFDEYGQEGCSEVDERVLDVRCDEQSLTVDLMDGRIIVLPLASYPRLLHATSAQRAHWEKADGSYGICWPDLDEDLNVETLLRHAPAPTQALVP